MQKTFLSRLAVDKISYLRKKFWFSLIPLAPCLAALLSNKTPEEFEQLVGFSYLQVLSVFSITSFAIIAYLMRFWRCPVCHHHLGISLHVDSCPKCAAYLRLPRDKNVEYTEETSLIKGASALLHEDFVASGEYEKYERKKTRIRLQLFVFVVISIVISLLTFVSHYNSPVMHDPDGWRIAVVDSLLYLVGTFFFCWTAAWFFYVDEFLLKLSTTRWMEMVVAVYRSTIIRLIFVFLVGTMVFVLTAGIFGLYQFYNAVIFLLYPPKVVADYKAASQ